MAHTILAVEDDEHIAALIQFVFEREGFRVEIAPDGSAAAGLIDSGPRPDLVLLDMMLPGLSGQQLVERIRAKPEWAAIPVIMLTSQSHERAIVRALDAGASDYVIKPFRPEELVARVRRFLRARPSPEVPP